MLLIVLTEIIMMMTMMRIMKTAGNKRVVIRNVMKEIRQITAMMMAIADVFIWSLIILMSTLMMMMIIIIMIVPVAVMKRIK